MPQDSYTFSFIGTVQIDGGTPFTRRLDLTTDPSGQIVVQSQPLDVPIQPRDVTIADLSHAVAQIAAFLVRQQRHVDHLLSEHSEALPL